MVQERWIAPASFVILTIAYHLIFGQFFPTRHGTLGHDYSRIFPDLLDGYFWLKRNGIFEPFWFTPAFCGGQPALGAPESGYYSVAQFLTFVATPTTSVYMAILLFAALGFWGFYQLLRHCFASSVQAAVFGGALFMFNGFFVHRMLIGHFAFHGMMLIPWVAYLLLRPIENKLSKVFFYGALAGSILAYCVYSGMVHLLLPFALAVLGIACVHGLAKKKGAGLVGRGTVAVLVAAGLSAAKLSAALFFLRGFPRSDYSLPGVTDIWHALYLLGRELFFAPADIADVALPYLAGVQWNLNRHEWEYGITLVPLVVVLVGVSSFLVRTRVSFSRPTPASMAWAVLLGVVLALPLALNFYAPHWNALLKQIPLIKSSSNLLRWFLIFIPVMILVSALFLDKISHRATVRSAILALALAALVFINATKDRVYYDSQPYRPDTIVKAWQSAEANNTPAQIEKIGAFLDAASQIQITGNLNDLIVSGTSQIACNNPIFGYRLEHFPIKSLHIGSVFAEMDGKLNIKNPACYLYPEQNGCAYGDHFTKEQVQSARAFIHYQPFPFNIPTTQLVANWTTQISLIGVVLFFAFMLSAAIYRAIKRR
jgi:hypothetical protein